MTDITPLFSTLLTQKHAPAIPPKRSPPPPADEFLKEAYRIATHISSLLSHLQTTRQSYLSTARSPSSNHLTDAHRDGLDAETKTIIRSTLALIGRLESAEKVRVQTETRLFRQRHSTLKSLFEDESKKEREEAGMRVVTAHREGVIWFLKNRLEKASEEQRERQEIRLQRQIERGKSLLHKAPVSAGGVPPASRSVVMQEEEEETRRAVEELSPDQLRIFEKENEGMLKHYEDTLEQVRTAENSLLEISSLQTQLATNLATQNSHIDNLLMDSMQTAEDVNRGNKELKKAAEKTSMARSAFFGTVVFCGVVFVWDWFI
ncbi:snare-complex protein syntaxin-18 N-terminus-domain-containing protein [Tricharina praecox]|uniref:snare-complex protein syntaxin-18 N-terminus-domain-containing protein n=1 Tax=Tricharina praecox TaxID=43433 RepID=UPI0022210FD5|nr:snare-complex protein syntaxin-18 N-terminus-domain-containing protein [Tricharina praecox]KAI5858451.1 snare-complex protein syntaxin-18 N-terminus-domain-containing protein [Tricharina praecox]